MSSAYKAGVLPIELKRQFVNAHSRDFVSNLTFIYASTRSQRETDTLELFELLLLWYNDLLDLPN